MEEVFVQLKKKKKKFYSSHRSQREDVIVMFRAKILLFYLLQNILNSSLICHFLQSMFALFLFYGSQKEIRKGIQKHIVQILAS